MNLSMYVYQLKFKILKHQPSVCMHLERLRPLQITCVVIVNMYEILKHCNTVISHTCLTITIHIIDNGLSSFKTHT